MNVFSHVTSATLRRNRLRTTVTIIGILLSAAMFTAITTICSSLFDFMEKTYIYENGNWHLYAQLSDDALEAEIAADKRVTALAELSGIGYAELDGASFNRPYAYVAEVNSDFFDIMPVHLTSGRLPANGSELIVPETYSVSVILGSGLKLGDTLNLELGERFFDNEKLGQSVSYIDGETFVPITESEREYTVVGIYEQPDFEDYRAPGYTMLTSGAPAGDRELYIKLSSPHGQLDSFIAEHLSDIDYSRNTRVLMFSGLFPYDNISSAIYTLVGIFVLIIMLGSVSLIYSAFSISVSERTKQFGLLSSVGATKRQLRSCVLYEAGLLSLCGIPLGIVCGIGGIGVTFAAIGDKFNSMISSPFSLTLSVSWVAVAVAALLSLLTVFISAMIPARRAMRVSAIDAIRQSTEITTRRAKAFRAPVTMKLFGLEGVLAKKYYKRSRRKYRVTIISLIMSFVLFVSAASFCDYISLTYDANVTEYDYDYAYFGGTGAQISALRGQIKALDGIEEFSYSYAESDSAVIPKSQFDDSYIDYLRTDAVNSGDVNFEIPEDYSTYVYRIYLDDESWNALAAGAGMQNYTKGDAVPSAILWDNISTIGYYKSGNSYNRIPYQYHLLSADADEINIYNDSELSKSIPEGYNGYSLVKGERGYVWRYYPYNYGNDENSSVLDVPAVPETLQIGGRTETRPFTRYFDSSALLICPLSSVDPDGAQEVTLYIKCDAEKHDETIAALTSILEDSGLPTGDAYYNDIAENQREGRNLIMIINVFSYGFIILISLISAANVFNTITTNIALRRRDFAMLKSIGMTERGRVHMMYYECLLYGTRSLLFGIPISVAISYLIYYSAQISTYSAYTIPWFALGVAALSIFVVVFASMVYAMKKIKRDNPIDALKNENI